MNSQAVAVILSWLKIFTASVLTAVLTSLATDVWDWKTIVFAGLVSVLPVIINWLSPSDPRYGRGYVAPAGE
jgi:hypothetical protein